MPQLYNNLIEGDLNQPIIDTSKKSKPKAPPKDEFSDIVKQAEDLKKLQDAHDALPESAKSARAKVQKTIDSATEALKDKVETTDTQIKKGKKYLELSDRWNSLKTSLSDMFEPIAEVVQGVGQTISDAADRSQVAFNKDPLGVKAETAQLKPLISPAPAAASLTGAQPVALGQPPAKQAQSMVQELSSRYSMTEPVQMEAPEMPSQTVQPPTYTPMPTYKAPETPQEAMKNPVSMNDRMGGPGTIGYESGFDAKNNAIDQDLQDQMAELTRKRGLVAVIQGLGMAASGWYGLHNNIDMTKINFNQMPSFEAEEKAILEKAKFRREQLLDQRKEDIRRVERASDVEQRGIERAQDRADTQAYRELQSQQDKVNQINQEKWNQWRAEINNRDFDYKKEHDKQMLAFRAAEKTSNARAKFAAASSLDALKVQKDLMGTVDKSEDKRAAAITGVANALKSVNPELREALDEIVDKTLNTGYFDNVSDADPQVFMDKLGQLPGLVWGKDSKAAMVEFVGSTETSQPQAAAQPVRQLNSTPAKYNPQKERIVQSIMSQYNMTRDQAIIKLRSQFPTKGF